MVSELIWGFVIAASTIASVLVALPLLERWATPSTEPRPRSGTPAKHVRLAG